MGLNVIQRVLPAISPSGFAPRPVWKEAEWPVSLLCSRNAAHGINRICILREVLVHARTFEAKRATPEERGQIRGCRHTSLQAPGENRVLARWGWVGEKAPRSPSPAESPSKKKERVSGR
jgi:hypothetical protein